PAQTGTPARETAAEIVSTPTPSPSPTNIFMLPPKGQNYSSFETPVFPFLTPAFGQLWETPTPIATASKNLNQYRLKEWEERDGFDLIKLMEESARANDILSACESRYRYFLAQFPLKLALEDYLIKFPESSLETQVRWRLALNNVTQNSQDSDEWLFSQIEDDINQGKLNPENLSAGLSQYGFEIDTFDDPTGEMYDINEVETFFVENLLGEDRDGQIFHISSQEILVGDGSYIAISQDEQGYFSVELIHSGWNFNAAGRDILNIGDHTQDGIPEIILREEICGCSCSPHMAFVYQYRDGEFVDLGQGQLDIRSILGGGISFGELDDNGFEILELHSPSYSGNFIETFKWDGEYYQFAEKIIESLMDKYRANSDLEIASKLFEEIINSWPVDLDIVDHGDSYLDAFRFKHGLLFARHSEKEKTREIMMSIVESPYNPEITAIPQAAQAFLDHYNTEYDYYYACFAARKKLSEFTDPFLDANGYLDPEKQLQVLGYLGSVSFGVCPKGDMYRFIFNKIESEHLNDIPGYLRNFKIEVIESHKLDLDNDGDHDWVILTDESLWLVLNLGDRAKSYLLDDVLDYDYKTFPEIVITNIEFPEVGALNLMISLGDTFYVFQIDNTLEEGTIIDHYVGDIDDLGNIFKFGGQFAILRDNWRSDSVWSFYLWDSKAAHFEEVDIYSDYFLNAKTSPDGFHNLEMLNGYIDKQGLTPNPRWLYLQGLGYELTGEAGKAAEIYYRLWREHPDSAYALMARAKLEPVSP
ncbi:MAG: hypothetical protein OEY10_05580, partial [Nitrosopumilus sp.]|nr:hypothetical protein [Nitrosopumilus sp.]